MSCVYSCVKGEDLGLLSSGHWCGSPHSLIPLPWPRTSPLVANYASCCFRIEQPLTTHSHVPMLLPFCSLGAWTGPNRDLEWHKSGLQWRDQHRAIIIQCDWCSDGDKCCRGSGTGGVRAECRRWPLAMRTAWVSRSWVLPGHRDAQEMLILRADESLTLDVTDEGRLCRPN